MADQLSRVFQALADPTRRDMVARLATADATVGELAAPYDVSLQAVSKHLKVLEEAGLVSRSRDAQRRPVHLEAEVFDLMTKWIERYQREAEERFRRLDAAAGPDGRRRDRPSGRRRSSIMSATTKHETEIIVPEGLPIIELKREFDAPVDRLFRAWVDPDLFAQWVGPRSIDTRIDEWDCRTGGRYRYAVGARRTRSGGFYGSFHEVRRERAHRADVHLRR